MKCKCGAKLLIPANAKTANSVKLITGPNDRQNGDYEMNVHPDDEHYPNAIEDKERAKCPACNQHIRQGAKICVKCGYDLASGKRMQTYIADTTNGEPLPAPRKYGGGMPIVGMASPILNSSEEEEARIEQRYQFREFYLPLIMIGMGLVVVLTGSIVFNPNHLEGLIIGGIFIGAQVVVMMPLFLISIFIAAKVLDADFGLLHKALLKLTGICIGSGAIGDVISMLIMPHLMTFCFFFPGIFGIIFIFFSIFLIYLLLIGIPLALMFDLDLHETIWTIVIIITVRVVSIALFTMLF